MRKALAIALVALLMLPFAAHYSALHWQKWVLKREVKHKLMAELPDDCLVKLSFSQAEVKQVLNWEHDKEFEFNKQMYDVVRSCQKADSIIYFCWPDSEESKLNKKLKALLQDKANHEETTRQSKRAKAKSGKWEFEKNEPIQSNNGHLPIGIEWQLTKSLLPFFSINCETPPPEKSA